MHSEKAGVRVFIGDFPLMAFAISVCLDIPAAIFSVKMLCGSFPLVIYSQDGFSIADRVIFTRNTLGEMWQIVCDSYKFHYYSNRGVQGTRWMRPRLGVLVVRFDPKSEHQPSPLLGSGPSC